VKKSLSILLVVLLMLNVLGYYLVFLGLQYKSTYDTTLRIDSNNYSVDEEITIKVPLAIPYMENKGYERVTGEIEHNGEYFTLVKQKLQNDTLFIVCIKNHDREKLANALGDYVKTFTATPADSHQAKTIPAFIKDFLPSKISLESSVAGWMLALDFRQCTNACPSAYLTINSPPPRV
jgi:hypothetical protein